MPRLRPFDSEAARGEFALPAAEGPMAFASDGRGGPVLEDLVHGVERAHAQRALAHHEHIERLSV